MIDLASQDVSKLMKKHEKNSAHSTEKGHFWSEKLVFVVEAHPASLARSLEDHLQRQGLRGVVEALPKRS